MPKRAKVNAEVRAECAKACAEGRVGQREAARRLAVASSTVDEWVQRYKAGGVLAFRRQKHNTVYSAELKQQAVEE